MPLDLPYFKFIPTEWLTGNICFEDLEMQGLFINICALYWQRSGKLSVEDIEKRYKKPFALQSLLSGYTTVTDGFISIKFLDEQLEQFTHKSVVNSLNGKKGGRPKGNTSEDLTERKPKKTERLAKKSHIEVEKEVEIEIKIDKKNSTFVPPTKLEVIDYFAELGTDIFEGEKYFDYYLSKGWMVGRTKMKDWKAAARNWKNNIKTYGNNTNRTGKQQLTPEVAAAWLNLGRK